MNELWLLLLPIIILLAVLGSISYDEHVSTSSCENLSTDNCEKQFCVFKNFDSSKNKESLESCLLIEHYRKKDKEGNE